MDNLLAPSLQSRLEWVVQWPGMDGSPIPRFQLLLDGQAVWDYPTDFYGDALNPPRYGRHVTKQGGCWDGIDPEVTIGFYLDQPLDKLFETLEEEEERGRKQYRKTHTYNYDPYGLGDILRACDRRIGYKRLLWWSFSATPAPAARKILGARFEGRKPR